jgi:hypothetical protein
MQQPSSTLNPTDNSAGVGASGLPPLPSPVTPPVTNNPGDNSGGGLGSPTLAQLIDLKQQPAAGDVSSTLPPLDNTNTFNSGNFGMSPAPITPSVSPTPEINIPSSNSVASLIDKEASNDTTIMNADKILQPNTQPVQPAVEIPPVIPSPTAVSQPTAPAPAAGGFAQQTMPVQPTVPSTNQTSEQPKKAGANWGMLLLALFIFVVGVLALLLGIYYATNTSIPWLDSILRK